MIGKYLIHTRSKLTVFRNFVFRQRYIPKQGVVRRNSLELWGLVSKRKDQRDRI